MFNHEDFKEHSVRLQVIIMNKLNKSLLTSFHTLSYREKMKFNILLNQYIQSLPNDNWLDVILEDFNDLCLDNIFTDNFDPSKCYCPDVNMNLQLIPKEEEQTPALE